MYFIFFTYFKINLVIFGHIRPIFSTFICTGDGFSGDDTCSTSLANLEAILVFTMGDFTGVRPSYSCFLALVVVSQYH